LCRQPFFHRTQGTGKISREKKTAFFHQLKNNKVTAPKALFFFLFALSGLILRLPKQITKGFFFNQHKLSKVTEGHF
jgi:hypothetical protein